MMPRRDGVGREHVRGSVSRDTGCCPLFVSGQCHSYGLCLNPQSDECMYERQSETRQSTQCGCCPEAQLAWLVAVLAQHVEIYFPCKSSAEQGVSEAVRVRCLAHCSHNWARLQR